MLGWGGSYYLISTLARPMAEAFGLSVLTVFGMFSAGLVASAIVGPRIGRRIDRQGGRSSLMTANVAFAVALVTLATAAHPFQLALGWLLLCLAMPLGLYDAAFATLVGLFGRNARGPITAVTLIAGLGSALSWPVTAAIESQLGWRAACLVWALFQLGVGFWLHRALPISPAQAPVVAESSTPEIAPAAQRRAYVLLALSYLTISTLFSAMASHLPRLLELHGLGATAAVATASLFGVSQIVGRLFDLTVLRRWAPLQMARMAHLGLLVGALLMVGFGAPFAACFTILHGLGIGLLTICKSLLPLSMFGPEGFARRAALIDGPARLAGAVTPFLFGYAIDRLGSGALWLYLIDALIGVTAVFLLRSKSAAIPATVTSPNSAGAQAIARAT